MPRPEQSARAKIDVGLGQAGWSVQDADALKLDAARGVAAREFPLARGHGTADYILYVDRHLVGAVEAKPEGHTLTGVEPQTMKYAEGVPAHLPAVRRPLPFLYESTGSVTRFTSLLDPDPRSREVFSFHRPETFARWLWPLAAEQSIGVLAGAGVAREAVSPLDLSLAGRLRQMPPLDPKGLWEAQATAVRNLEKSFAENRPRALIQMATGSGKTFMAITSIYRLVKHAGAERVLFLVDRANLGRQALKEFQRYDVPGGGRKFTEEYNVQHLTSNRIEPVNRVVITTIQRLYSMLQGQEDLPPGAEEGSSFDALAGTVRDVVPVAYNPAVPIDLFDVIFVDECHRSIYSLWRQVLDYFDAYIVGLTATPSKQTFGFFDGNLVTEYPYERAVADGVNVDFDVYRIRTRITERGSTIEAGPYEVVGKRDRQTRRVRWEKLDEDLAYDPDQLDRDVVAPDQIRTIVRTFKDKLFTEIFPGRKDVPKTLIYAKNDSHADDIVQVIREEFGKGNDFCEKITYRTGVAREITTRTDDHGNAVEQTNWRATGVKAENLLASFRNSYNPRLAVTVDMIATGTDIKPLEVVMFMRAVRSRLFFEQMKGRGVRVIDDNEFQQVTPDAKSKTRFVIVDCVGVCEKELHDTRPLERKRSWSFAKLLEAVGQGSTDPDIAASLASRLARLERKLDPEQREEVAQAAGGKTLGELAAGMVDALDSDHQVEEARSKAKLPAGAEPSDAQVEEAAKAMLKLALRPLAQDPALRARLADLHQRAEQVIDEASVDEVTAAEFSDAAREKARWLVSSFRKFIEDNRTEITALQVLYSRPYRQRLRFEDIKALADAIKAPPRSWTPEVLWRAYETLDRDRVRAGGPRLLTDIVSLVRFTLEQEPELLPFGERVRERFSSWLAQQESLGRRFTPEQRDWLELIRDHVATSMGIEMDDFDGVPFAQRGGAGRAFQVFGKDLPRLLDELNGVLAA